MSVDLCIGDTMRLKWDCDMDEQSTANYHTIHALFMEMPPVFYKFIQCRIHRAVSVKEGCWRLLDAKFIPLEYPARTLEISSVILWSYTTHEGGLIHFLSI